MLRRNRPAVAQHYTHGIRALSKLRGDIIGCIQVPLLVGRPGRIENVRPHLLAVEPQFYRHLPAPLLQLSGTDTEVELGSVVAFEVRVINVPVVGRATVVDLFRASASSLLHGFILGLSGSEN